MVDSALYQEVILEHNKNPRNFKVVADHTHTAFGKNPLCGDQYVISLKVDENGVVQDVGFQGDGCAISKASASMMTSFIKGKPVEEVLKLKEAFHYMLTDQQEKDHKSCLGRLVFFEGVKEYPVRVKCATLAWHTLSAALEGKQETTTE